MIFNRTNTGFAALDTVLSNLFAIKAPLLLVLNRPDPRIKSEGKHSLAHQWLGRRHPLPCRGTQKQRLHPRR